MSTRAQFSADPPAREQRFSVALVFLSIAFIVAHADKQILSLLAQPIKVDLGLSDTQLGLLQGFSFTFFYAIAGIPIARFLDKGARVRIAALCVVIWSAATLGCGLVGSFLLLLLLRMGTAVAEAGLPPAAFSIFSDLADPKKVARSSAIFMLAPFIGGGLALLGGAGLLWLFEDMVIGWSAWRGVFLVLGIAGIFIGLALGLVVREPQRKDGDSAQSLPPLGQVFRAIFSGVSPLGAYFAAMTLFTMFLYAVIAWFPVLLIRRFDLSVASVGSKVGGIYLVCGVLGTLATLAFTARGPAPTSGRTIARFRTAALLLIPVALGIALSPSQTFSLVLYGIYAFVSASIICVMVVPMQLLLPSRMQARSIAIFSLCTTAVGGSIGPLAVGMLADSGLVDIGALALASVVPLVGAVLLFHLAVARAGSRAVEAVVTATQNA